MKPQTFAPVVLFAYNRADKLENCIKHLEKCREAYDSDLFIFCDGPKRTPDEGVEKVRKFVNKYKSLSKFKSVTVTTQKENRGLASSIIAGVTEIVDIYGKVIVVEDDLIVLPSFLRFLNGGLSYYEDDMNYGSICGFNYPLKKITSYNIDVFATRKADCWGWATWADRWNDGAWKDIDLKGYLNNWKQRLDVEKMEAGLDRLMYLQYKGKIDSWAVRWIYYLYQKGQLTVYPLKSHVINDGFDGSGTHCADGYGANFNVKFSDEIEDIRWEKCAFNSELAKACAVFPRRKLCFYIPETLFYLLRRG